MFYNNDITDTLNSVRELAQSGDTTKGLDPDVVKSFTTALGLIPYNLATGAKLLAPVITPVRNLLPRSYGGGGRNKEFKAVTSYNSTNASAWAVEGSSGPEIFTTTVDCVFPYRIAGLKNYLTFEGFYTAKGQIDAKALMMANLLRALMIDEEDRLLFGNPATALYGASLKNTNVFPYLASSSPFESISGGGSTVAIGGSQQTAVTALLAAQTAAASAATNVPGTYYINTTGGSIGAYTFTYYISVLTGPDYGAGSGKTQESQVGALTTTSALSGTTNSLVIVPTTVPNAVAYVLYIKKSTDTTYVRIVGNGRFNLTTFGTGANSGLATLPAADTSGSANAYAGIAQQILTSANGAVIYDKHLYPNATGNPYSLNANPQTTNDIDTLFQQLWNVNRADPDFLLMNAQESISISNSLANTPFFVQPQGMQNETLAGGSP